jgi:hypothetical protein
LSSFFIMPSPPDAQPLSVSPATVTAAVAIVLHRRAHVVMLLLLMGRELRSGGSIDRRRIAGVVTVL